MEQINKVDKERQKEIIENRKEIGEKCIDQFGKEIDADSLYKQGFTEGYELDGQGEIIFLWKGKVHHMQFRWLEKEHLINALISFADKIFDGDK